jgi:YesN/AraC family two-component response regulator
MDKDFLLNLKKIGQNFTMLYVEDEENVRDMMESLLKEFFSAIYVAKSGQEGLEIFKANTIDIVLTDLEMPIMNGLDMIEKIRELSLDVPIGIISAFSNSEKFTRAIRYGVNRYLLKPIEQDNVLHTINDILTELQNKKDAKEYQQKLQNEKLSKAVKKTAQYFLHSIPSPVLVVDSNKKIVYINELLNDMLLQKDTKVQSGDSSRKIESIFSLDSGEEVSIEKIKSDSSQNQKIIYKHKNSTLYFIPLKQMIEIPTVDGKGAIIVLNDVTVQMKQIRMIGYQKQKLKSNNEILEEFLHRNVFKVSKEKKKEVKIVLEKSGFNENEALLRRSHTYKISAVDYMTTLSDTIEDDLEELMDLELDLKSELYEFEYAPKYESLELISNMFKSYAKILIGLIEFSDLGAAVESVAEYLDELTQEHVDSNAFMIKEVIQSIHNDLSNWNEIVFVTQNTDDIHYLDSSLYSTIVELKNVFEADENDEDEDELEFF